MGCTLAFAMQITSIIAGALYVILAFVDLIKFWGFVSLFANVFAIILGFTCIIIEIYVFDFFKYFAFLFTNWGRSAFYLFLAVNIFRNNVNICTFINKQTNDFSINSFLGAYLREW